MNTRKGCSCWAIRWWLVSVSAINLCSISLDVLGGCQWTSSNLSVYSDLNNPDIRLDLASYTMLANQNWYDGTRVPVGTLMALSNLTLGATTCISLVELRNRRVDVVYVPPADATPSGMGYLLPSTAAGVSMRVEFLQGTPHAYGILLGTSSGTLNAGGYMSPPRSGLPSIALRLSLLKTGAFAGNGTVWFANGLGRLRYFAAGNSTESAAEYNQFVLSSILSPSDPARHLATAAAPSCDLQALGEANLALGQKVISLSPVSGSDFSGPGAINGGTRARSLTFSCTASANSNPLVSFSATYPLSGADGVGLPESGSDIGVQVLLGDVPVKFGMNSNALQWTPVRFDDQGLTVAATKDHGPLSAQGRYCLANCGTDMSNANWLDGAAASGNNYTVPTVITFKYYQTGAARPAPRSFSVPFTVTIEVD